MRKKKVLINAAAGLMLQTLQIIFAFIFPRLVMSAYGSEVNGILQSITQFLSYIALLDAGVSAVIRAKLYKPLAEKDNTLIQAIINSAKRYYRKIALIFIVYLVLVTFLFPLSVLDFFDYGYTASLIIIIGISTIFEYFFGISYQVLLDADQRKYIFYIIQSASVLLNTLVSSFLIYFGASIHVVKFITSFIFVIRPIVLSMYCKRRYAFAKNNHKLEVIDNQWSGMAHHIAYFLHTHTDIVLLTFAKGPLIVSVYSVYNMVVSGLVNVINLMTGGIEAAFGNMNAKNEKESIDTGLQVYELLIFSIVTVVFSTALLTIMPFVAVYTKGITDTNYFDFPAATLLIIAEALYCIRMPYQALVMSTGKLKETMKGAFVEVGINVISSIVLVWKFGIAGVAFGTLCAMLYRTIEYAIFVSKKILCRKISYFIKHCFVSLGTVLIIVVINHKLPVMQPSNYFVWVLLAVKCMVWSVVFVITTNFLFYRNESLVFLKMLKGLFKRK